MKIDVPITADMRINEVIRAHPDTVAVFHRLELDACCGGDKTLAEASVAHGLELDAVLRALEERAGPSSTQ